MLKPEKASPEYYIAGLLMACYTLSFIDRQIMAVMVDPIKASLHLSDSEIGFLQGTAISICFTLFAVPIARLMDRGHRPLLLAACVAMWSVMTAACGAAVSFATLLLTRTGVAIGEAGLPPGSLAVMGDVIRPKRLPMATALFMTAPYVGGGLALSIGTRVYQHASTWGALPWLGRLEPWQMTFALVGAPGLLLAALVWLTVPEPRRASLATVEVPAFSKVIAVLVTDYRFYVTYLVAVSLVALYVLSQIAWIPTALMRSFHLGLPQVGPLLGPVYLGAGTCGSLSAGWLANRTRREKSSVSVIKLMLGGTLLLLVPAFIAPLVPNFKAAVALIGMSAFLYSGILGLAPVPIQLAAPERMRAQLLAFMGLMNGLVGAGVGPFVTGVFSDHLFTSDHALGESLSLVAALSLLPTVGLLLLVLMGLKSLKS